VMNARPPDRNTRATSCITALGSAQCSRTSVQITQSKLESPNGRASAEDITSTPAVLCGEYGTSALTHSAK